MRIPKKLNLFMAGFVYLFSVILPIIILQGCSMNSPLLSARDNKASIIIEKPPMRIIVSGEYHDIDEKAIIKIMKELKTHKYHNYNFDDSIIIDSEHATVHKDDWKSSSKRR